MSERDIGYWICDRSSDPPYCSVCLTYAIEDKYGDFAMTNYCPDCGARMAGINREGITCQPIPVPLNSTGATLALKYVPHTDCVQMSLM